MPTLGLSLTSSVTIASSAFLASAASCNALVGSMNGNGCSTAPIEYESATSAYNAWSNQCEEHSILPFSTFDAEQPPRQHAITARVRKKLASELQEGSDWMKIMRMSMNLLEAKTWIKCRPSGTLKTSIPHHHFRVWLQYFCHVPLFHPGSKCARPQCAAVMDVYGDHPVSTGNDIPTGWRDMTIRSDSKSETSRRQLVISFLNHVLSADIEKGRIFALSAVI